nr:hypothetical protein [Francisella orientalis]
MPLTIKVGLSSADMAGFVDTASLSSLVKILASLAGDVICTFRSLVLLIFIQYFFIFFQPD